MSSSVTSSSDSMEKIQKLILETLEKDSSIPDTRVFGQEFSQQQIHGVLMRLESHQVMKCK
jgi:hypothetical protein